MIQSQKESGGNDEPTEKLQSMERCVSGNKKDQPLGPSAISNNKAERKRKKDLEESENKIVKQNSFCRIFLFGGKFSTVPLKKK